MLHLTARRFASAEPERERDGDRHSPSVRPKARFTISSAIPAFRAPPSTRARNQYITRLLPFPARPGRPRRRERDD
jgi:hypothetical protein